MNRTRRLSLLSLFLSFVIVVSSMLGIIFCIIQYGFVEAVRTYGFILNLLLLIGSVYLFIHDCKSLYDGKDKTTKGIYFYMLVCAVSLFNASIFYFILINNRPGIMYKFSISSVFFNIVTPVLAMILVITTIIKYPFDIKDSFYSTTPSLLYGVSYFFMLLSTGKTYDFYNLFEEGKLWLTGIYLIAFVLSAFLISLITIAIHNNITSFGSNSKLIIRNGQMIPRVGFSTYEISNEDAERLVSEAISVGYTHIDTATSYGNEEGVGKAIKSCGVERKRLFITTKIPAEVKDYESAKKCIEESLKKLDLTYIDLLLIHCPQPWDEYASGKNYDKENLEVWKAMEEAYTEGKIKSIGVSNFNIHDLENIMKNGRIPPMVNQICCYIGNTPLHLIKYCQKKKIVVEAYSPLGQGEILNDKRAKDMAIKYHASIPKLSVRYSIDLGCVSLPKSSSKEHMIENFDTDIRLKKGDVELMASFADQDFAEHKRWPIYNTRDYYEID